MRRRQAVFGRKGVAGRAAMDAAPMTGAAQVVPDGVPEREARKPVMEPAQLLYCSGRVAVNVLLRDLSSQGARIVAHQNLPETDGFDLAHGGMVRPCRIVWRGNGAIGVRFTGTARRHS